MEKPQVTVDDFLRLDIRVGKVVSVEDFPKARKPAYKLTIDFGELGFKRSSAQITKHYKRDDLVDTYVVAVVNFPPRQIADMKSEVLVLGVLNDADEVVLLRPDRKVELGKPIG